MRTCCWNRGRSGIFFFSSRRRHTRWNCDWSSDVCSSDLADLLTRGESPNEIAVVVRHIETYGEMIDDVFTRYGIPHGFETGVPLLRIPFIKYWLALLDLA